VRKRIQRPIALTIAGSDSGGGAGIQADLKTFASLGVHGTCAVTCVTAQNPKEVVSIHDCPARTIREQIQTVMDELPPAAVKTGMLHSSGAIRTVIEVFGRHRGISLVVDPVMVSTSGARLLKRDLLNLLKSELLPIATLVTPNLSEAEVLLNATIRSLDDMRAAAREMSKRFGCAAVIKGGHLGVRREAVDVFFDGKKELLLKAAFVTGVRTHGTGCVFSAAIAAWLAKGFPLDQAVKRAKVHISRAIARGGFAQKHFVLASGE
jgi:hydroxymethylpyrimidine/phosphomethylpyrimidine kinase